MTHDPFVPPAGPTPPPADFLPPSAGAPLPDAVVLPHPRPPTGLAVAVIVMSWIWVAWLVVLGFAADASEDVWRDAVERGLPYADTDPAPFAMAYLPVRGFLVAAFVVMSLWLNRSRRFAEAHNPGFRFFLPAAWTWLCWVVPLVSLWFPAWVVTDVWRATLRRRVAWFRFPWWGCWLLMLWLSWTAEDWRGGIGGIGVLGDEVLLVGESYIACAVLAALSCWAWTAIVLRIRRGQQMLAG
jgi:hypothetical protein